MENIKAGKPGINKQLVVVIYILTATIIIYGLFKLPRDLFWVLLLVIPVLFVSIWTLWYRPELYLILALWTMFIKGYFIPGLSFGSFGVTPVMLFTSLSALGYGLQVVLGRRRLILPIGWQYLLLFFVTTFLSLLWVRSLMDIVGVFIRTVLKWIVYILMLQYLVNRKALTRLITAIYVHGAIVVNWGVIAGLQVFLFGRNRQNVFFWTQITKNDYAVYVALIALIALGTIMVSKKRWQRWLGMLLLIETPIAWMFTYSRGGLLAIVSGFAVFVFLERKVKSWSLFVLIAVIALVVALGIFPFLPEKATNLVVEGITSLITLGQSTSERFDVTIDYRVELIKEAIKVFSQRPIRGIGFNQWQYYSPVKYQYYEAQTNTHIESGMQIHNRLLVILVHNGILGFIAYVLFLLETFLSGVKASHTTDRWMRIYILSFVAAFAAQQVALLFAPSIVMEWPVFALVSGVFNIIDREHNGDLPRNRYLQFKRVTFNDKT